MTRPLTLGELLEEINRQAIDPHSVTFSVEGSPVAAWSFDYDIVHQPGGPVIEFSVDDDEDMAWIGLDEDEEQLCAKCAGPVEATSGQG